MVRGDLNDILLTSLIQVICQQGETARLSLWRPNQSGTLYFEDGEVTHATLGQLTGEAAVYALLAWPGGEFELQRQPVHQPRTIAIPWTGLLLEGMNQVDEQAAAQVEADRVSA